MSARALTVDAQRLAGWVAGFGERHGGLTGWDGGPEGALVTAGDGSTAVLDPPFPGPACSGAGELLAHAVAPRRVAVLLARRGGYACAVVEAGRVSASKVGSRYVQSRTAAGGWSQQRYARRRANQADDLVGALVEHALRLVVPAAPGWVVTGGDRPLVDQALADPRLRLLADLPRGRHLTVADPSGRLVADLPRLLHTFQIRLKETEPA